MHFDMLMFFTATRHTEVLTMQESLESSLVRIRTTDGRVVGAGFLVGERHILTCAHVISQAFSLPNTPADPPQGLVSLDFPLIPPRTLLTARAVLWCSLGVGFL